MYRKSRLDTTEWESLNPPFFTGLAQTAYPSLYEEVFEGKKREDKSCSTCSLFEVCEEVYDMDNACEDYARQGETLYDVVFWAAEA